MEFKKFFDVVLLVEAVAFINDLDFKTRTKLYYNLSKAQYVNDASLFKKLNAEIWEFRTLYARRYYRLLAFWDRRDSTNTLVVVIHVLIKKVSKVSKGEIDKASQIRLRYFNSKTQEDGNKN